MFSVPVKKECLVSTALRVQEGALAEVQLCRRLCRGLVGLVFARDTCANPHDLPGDPAMAPNCHVICEPALFVVAGDSISGDNGTLVIMMVTVVVMYLSMSDRLWMVNPLWADCSPTGSNFSICRACKGNHCAFCPLIMKGNHGGRGADAIRAQGGHCPLLKCT